MKFSLSAVIICFVVLIGWTGHAQSAPLKDTIAQVKPSIVGVGTQDPMRRPQFAVLGTGFAVGDGLHIITARHVLFSRNVGGESAAVKLAIFLGDGEAGAVREAEVVHEDTLLDITILKITGASLPVLRWEDNLWLEDGTEIAFTGYPIGAAYGLYKATHRGMVSATMPLATPTRGGGALSAEAIANLRKKRLVYQLDATSLPGNSGGPIYDPETGVVMGMINAIHVHESKETGQRQPTGISFAIPSSYLAQIRAEYMAKRAVE
jgi:S1-C subfamily serine protease